MREGNGGDEGEEEIFVIAKIAEGFRVYPVSDRRAGHVVSSDGSQCSCGKSAGSSNGTPARCRHVEVVEACGRRAESAAALGGVAEQGREKTGKRPEGQPAKEANMAGNGSGVVIKRSVSPDGRIDSLSVEVGFPVENLQANEIKTRAENALRLQGEIVDGFLGKARSGNGSPAPEGPRGNGVGDGSIAAEIVRVGGMPGKWGRRLFLTVKTEDRMLRLYGNRKELAGHLHGAGYTESESGIVEGLELSLPCRIMTKLNGNFLNIDRVLPAADNGARGNGR